MSDMNTTNNDVMLVLVRVETKFDAHALYMTSKVDDHEGRIRTIEQRLPTAKSHILPVGGGLTGVAGFATALWQALAG